MDRKFSNPCLIKHSRRNTVDVRRK